jgi:O-antigen ligase
VIATTSTTRSWDLLRLTLAATVLTVVWRVQDVFPVLAPARLPALMLFVLLLALVISPREQWRLALASRTMVMRGVLAIVVLALLSVPTSLYKGLSFDFFARNLIPSVVLGFAAAAASYTVNDARRVAGIQLAGGMFYAVVILLRFDVGADARLGSLVHYDANDLGMLMVCVLPLALYFIHHGAQLVTRLAAGSAAALCVLTIIKTGSRGAFVALIAVTAYLLFKYSTVYWGRRVVTVLGIAVLFFAATGSQYRTAILSLLNPSADYNWTGRAEGGRMEVWKRGLTYMADRPLTGVGLNAFPIAEGTLSPIADRQMFSRGVRWSAAHSSYIQIGAELGVFALVVFIATIVGALVMAGRLARTAMQRGDWNVSALASAQGAGLVGFAVAGAFLSHAYSPILLLSIGTIVGLHIAAREAWRVGART